VPGTYTAQIGTSSTTSPITFHSGTSYAIIGPGVEITNNSGGYVNALINIGQIGGISNIILDRVWCHGNENISETQRCLDVSSTTNVAVIDSTLTDFVCYTLGTCSDAQGILGGENCVNSNPEGPYKFVNDFIESTGENILFGGGCGLTVPADMEIRLNTFFKPRWWNAFDPSYVPAANGQSYEIKNLFELKNGNRVLFEGNTLQNSWASAQNGSAFLLTPVNQGGNCPTCEDANIASRYNTISTSCTPFELALVNNGSGDAAAGNSYSIHDNVADNQGYATGGCTTGQPGLELTEDTAITSPAQTINNVTLNHNTIVYAASRAALQAIISLTGPTIASGGVMYNIAVTNGLMWSGSQGTSNEQGGSHPANCANAASTPPSTVIPVCWNPNTVAGNCFVNNGSLTWPGTNTTSVASFTAVFNTYNGGNVGNYRVAAGACKGAATDGLDPGANITTLTSVLAGSMPPASTPTFLPPSGAYVGTQSVAISAVTGPVICWNTTGSPATNGTTGCTTGTLYTGAISVTSSETLYAVAGGTGYPDSSVGSAAYVINTSTVTAPSALTITFF
jgi:hypothetical protein